MTDPLHKIELLSEKMITLDTKVTAAHQRMDKFEVSSTQMLTDIKLDVKGIQVAVVELSAFMHRSKALASAFMFLAGIAGTFMLDKFFKFLPHLTTLFKGD